MTAWPAIQFEQEPAELAEFARYLRMLGFPHRISEQQGVLTLWVFDQADIVWVQQQFQAFLAGEVSMPSPRSQTSNAGLVALFSKTPVTFVLIIASVLGFLAVLTHNLEWVALLSFQGFDASAVDAQSAVLMYSHEQWLASMAEGQWWRLFTPMFLHFSWTHLAFNMVLLWYLGQQVERFQGSWKFLSWVLLLSLISNCAQYMASSNLFGGMSGVDYGLIAYCAVASYKNPELPYAFPRGLFWFAIVSIALGFLGLFSLLGMQIANWAHLAGFIAGFALALLVTSDKPFAA